MTITETLRGLFSRPKLFTDLIKEYNEKDAIENNLAKHTITKHEYQFNNVVRFLTVHGLQSMKARHVRVKTMELLRAWLYKDIQCKHDHATRHLRMCRNAIDHGVAMEYLKYNPLSGVKSKRDKTKEIVSLDLLEVRKLISFKATTETLEYCRDLFIFQCFTGLSYMDLWLFKITDDQEITWVTPETGRGKTKKVYWTELTPAALEIYNKYDGCLPYVCNQVYNKTVRKICKRVGIAKYITTHTGRKTFATLKDEEGFSLETIADMLGNTPEITRRHYINKSRARVKNEIVRLTGEKSSDLDIAV